MALVRMQFLPVYRQEFLIWQFKRNKDKKNRMLDRDGI